MQVMNCNDVLGIPTDEENVFVLPIKDFRQGLDIFS